MITVNDVAATPWRAIMDFGGARFYQAERFPSLYRRMRRRDDGSVEVRYACDADGVVTPSLFDVAATLETDRETNSERAAFTVGDDKEARDD